MGRRLKSYTVEDRVWSGRFARHGFSAPGGGVSVDEQRDIVERLRAEWFEPVDPIEVRRGRRAYGGTAWHGDRRIWLGPYCGAGAVSHEFAHIVAPGDHHGAIWRRCYVESVAIVLSAWHADRLRNGFERAGLWVAPSVDWDLGSGLKCPEVG